MNLALLPGIGVSLGFIFFFSGIGYAFQAANKLQIELEDKQEMLSAKIMLFFVSRPEWFIGTARLGYMLALVAFGILTMQFLTPSLARHLPSALDNFAVILTLEVFFATGVMVLIESGSRRIFLLNPNRALSLASVPFILCFIVLFPFMYGIASVAKFFTEKVLRMRYIEDKPSFGHPDTQSLYSASSEESKAPDLEEKILDNAIKFKDVKVRDCMIPRTEIIAVEVSDTIQTLREAFVRSGHDKVIVYRKNIDDVIGYCSAAALFRKPGRIDDILSPVITAPETTPANDLMLRFINERKSLAVVMDEFGGTSGMVTMEDVMEEIYGTPEEEHDTNNLMEQQLDSHTFLLNARLEVDYINRTFDLHLPTGDYDTLGGLILSHAEEFPRTGEVIVVPPYTFIVQSVTEMRIGIVKMTVAETPGGA